MRIGTLPAGSVLSIIGAATEELTSSQSFGMRTHDTGGTICMGVGSGGRIAVLLLNALCTNPMGVCKGLFDKALSSSQPSITLHCNEILSSSSSLSMDTCESSSSEEEYSAARALSPGMLLLVLDSSSSLLLVEYTVSS
jgi:hypothetical protein